jgi:hypothetical protein
MVPSSAIFTPSISISTGNKVRDGHHVTIHNHWENSSFTIFSIQHGLAIEVGER